MTQSDQKPDVVVIGGGPGGSTAATMLARQGLQVLLLERERFPRDHVGESLLPASVPVLEELGVLPAIQQAGFLPKWGATMVWGNDRTPWSWYFKETNQKYPHSYQVTRPQFDQILLDNCRSEGVDVREGHRVTSVRWEDGKAPEVGYETNGGQRQTVRPGFVVDASGQGGVLAHQLRFRELDPFFQNLAVYAYFQNPQRLSAPNETNIFIESYPQGWLWTIPLHTGQASVGAVVDSATGQEGIQRWGLQGFLSAQLSQAPETARLLQAATIGSGPFVVKDWSYVCRQMAGNSYVLVGDAACFVDPLFSSGVHLALMSGVLAAAYVTSALKDPSLGRAAAQVYQELYLKEYNQFREMARLFYSSNLSADSYFWEARRLAGDGLDFTPRQAFIRAVAGQPPKGYERAVLDRGEAPPEFLASVGAVEADRAWRRARLVPFQTDPTLQSQPRLHSDPSNTYALFRSAVPHLAQGVAVLRKPVLGQGEFQWGHVVTSPGYPEGAPCSALVAEMVSLIDGQKPVAELVSNLTAGLDTNQAAQVEASVTAALQILYIEGAIADLAGISPR